MYTDDVLAKVNYALGDARTVLNRNEDNISYSVGAELHRSLDQIETKYLSVKSLVRSLEKDLKERIKNVGGWDKNE